MKQRGFTLIELVISVVVIGFLALIMTKQFGTWTRPKQTVLWTAAHKMANNWIALTTAAGVTSDVTSVDVLAPGYTIPALLYLGKGAMDSQYQKYWDMAGIRPMSDLMQDNGSSYTVAKYPVTFAGGGTTAVRVTYRFVPDDVVTSMWAYYTGGTGTAPGATANQSGAVLWWGALGGTVTNVTVLVEP
jgi:prepilin-type N-terminal cleavage/methylation domain-containing protein